MKRGEQQGKCATGKVRYKSQLKAERQAAHAIVQFSRGDLGRREERVYRCRECDGWHLTSKPLRTVVS